MEAEQKKTTVFGAVMKYGLPLVVTVGLCWLMFRSIDFGQMIDIIRRQCDFRWIALGLALSVVSHVVRAFRWDIQLRALGIHAPKRVLIYSIFGTYAVNLVFPRLGEVWRTGYVAQRQRAPFATVFGSMVGDRLADTCTVALLLLLTFCLASGQLISYLSQNGDLYAKCISAVTSPWLWIAVAACIGAAWWFLTRKAAADSIIGRLQGFVRGLWQGFAVLATMRGKGLWLTLTVALWGCYFLQFYVAMFAFPFTAEAISRYGIICPLVAWVFSSIAMGVPSNGGIGPWQWAVIFGLGLYGVGQTDAAAFANLVLGTNTLLLILLGIYTFVGIMLDKKKTNQSINQVNNKS